MMSLISLTWMVSNIMAGGTGRRGGGGRGRWQAGNNNETNNRKYAHLVKVYLSIPIPFCLLLPNVPLCFSLFKQFFVNLLGVSPLVDTTHVGWSSSPAVLHFVLQWLDHLHSSSYFDHKLRIQTILATMYCRVCIKYRPPIHATVLGQG